LTRSYTRYEQGVCRYVGLPDAAAACRGSDLVLNAIPVQFMRRVWKEVAPHVGGAAVVSVAKGLELATDRRPTQIIAEALAPHRGLAAGRLELTCCALSGPTIAAELARRLPATMVAASGDEDLARRVQEWFSGPWLRVYRSTDLIGVELAGAAKNVIALAAGMVDGLEIGDNAKSALLARGLAEIARFGAAFGAETDTFFGVAGVGDLATTCFSPEGRNRTCGERLGRGEALDAILADTVHVIEGVPTTRALVALAGRHHVDMPITRAVHDILYDGLDPRDAIRLLMQRSLKAEGIA
jgi:glycerol-3-phosphate dehydrogenase (NAD(P)+)